jgi:hypothetical protein
MPPATRPIRRARSTCVCGRGVGGVAESGATLRALPQAVQKSAVSARSCAHTVQ